MEVLQLNVQRSYRVFDELIHHVLERKSKFDILLLQEPYVNRGKVPSLPGYVPFHMGPVPKAVVYVRSGLRALALNAVSDSMLAAVRVEGTMDRGLVFASGYFRGVEGDPIVEDLSRLSRLCNNVEGDILIGIEANAKATAWHSRFTGGRGSQLLEQVASLNLEILNTSGFLPTYMGPTGYGDIDVSLYRGSCNLLQRLSWRVLD